MVKDDKRDNPTITITDPEYGDERMIVALRTDEVAAHPRCDSKLDPFKADTTNVADPTTVKGTVYKVENGALKAIPEPITFEADGQDKVKGTWMFDAGNVVYDEPYILRVYVVVDGTAYEDNTSFTVVSGPR